MSWSELRVAVLLCDAVEWALAVLLVRGEQAAGVRDGGLESSSARLGEFWFARHGELLLVESARG